MTSLECGRRDVVALSRDRSVVGAPTLEYGNVRLRPLEMADAEALGGLVDDPALFKWAPGVPTDIASARDFISTALDARAAGTRTAFAVLDGDRIVGSTSYYEIDRANMATAIGYTFYTDSVQGTVVNPTCKVPIAPTCL